MREHFMETSGPLAIRMTQNSDYTQTDRRFDIADPLKPGPEMWQDVKNRAHSVQFLGYVRGHGDYNKLYMIGEQDRVGYQWYLIRDLF